MHSRAANQVLTEETATLRDLDKGIPALTEPR